MLRFGQEKVGKAEFCDVKRLIKIWDIKVENMVISKITEAKNNSKYFIKYSDDAMRPLVLILPHEWIRQNFLE